MRQVRQQRVLGTASALGLVLMAIAAPAQAQGVSGDPAAEDGAGGDIVVTGSRIRRSATDTAMPLSVVDQQDLTDRGFVTAAQALNNDPSINRQLAQASGTGTGSGNGVQAPALFGLGTGRTLTLLNGRRMVTTSSGLGDSQVDANVIPTGLLSRVEVVKAGGAAVYGSDAIAGVVNYVLKRDFQGIETDMQASVTGRGDFPTYSARVTAGTNFAESRGNVAINLEASHSKPLAFASRKRTQLSRITTTNSADTGPADGIPSVREVLDARFWEFNNNGVIFTTPAPVRPFLLAQFNPSGSGITPYDPGNVLGIPFAQGGQGFPYADLVGTLRTGIKRFSGNLIAHYDLTDSVTVSTELMYARTLATEVAQVHSNTVLGQASQAGGAIAFTRNNAFLTPEAIAALSALRPQFAAGAPLFLSKTFPDMLASDETTYRTTIKRGVLALDGRFGIGQRDFDWSVSGSYGEVNGRQFGYDVVVSRFNNAINAVRNASGQIVCAINAASVVDADCVPINPFGSGNVSREAAAYVSAPTGNTYKNTQVDFLATLGGAFLTLPAGDAKFSLAYEHRDEKARFTPLGPDRAGVFGLAPVVPQSGRYNTDEFSGEVLIPLVGNDFTLPLVHSLEVSGAFRHVINSAAGKENVWNIGLMWQPIPDVTLRASRGRNFRAPTLTQLFAPSAQNLQSGNHDPCDADRISGGPNPAQRRASCLALFQANPTYGTGGPNGAPAGADAATRLAAFQNSGENFTTTLVTTGGNPSLRNEVSKTWTYGIVIQPRFIPGLTFTADRIEIDLRDGLSAFTTQNFAEACFDDPDPAPGVCDAFTRLAAGNAQSQAGSYATGRTTTFNAGVIRYKGETYDLSYNLPLSQIWEGDPGVLDLQVVANRTALLETSVTGAVFTRTDRTAAQPRWSGRFDLRYTRGPFRFTYEAYYLGSVLALPNATIENNPHPKLDSNLTHSVSFQFDTGPFAFRFGVNNLTDKMPSYPSLNYGDIIGRQFYAGVRTRF